MNAMMSHLSGLVSALRDRRPWHRDLCDYYGVTPEDALVLGTRASGRRPALPGSSTTHQVSGKTFEEIWGSGTRQTPQEIQRFYHDLGAWLTFRQVVFHRSRSFAFIANTIQAGDRVCEYGAGVAPLAFWLVERHPRRPLHVILVDVPCEHLTFGAWRLRRRIQELRAPVEVEVQQVLPDHLPLTGQFDVISMLEVYEHLHNPVEVTAHLCEHLRAGGLLWENYIRHDHPHAADLAVAQQKRAEVFACLRQHCEQLTGDDPELAADDQTRCWKRRCA